MRKAIVILLTTILVGSGLITLADIDKSFDPVEAGLGEIIDVTVDITIPAGSTNAYFYDYLPTGLKYVFGSYMIDGVSIEPDYYDYNFIGDYISLDPATQQITFQVKVVEAKAWEDWTVTNDGRLYYYTDYWYYDQHLEDFTILPYWSGTSQQGLIKEIEEGPTEVIVGEESYWLIEINFWNFFDYVIDDAVIKDRLGGDLEVHDYEYEGAADPDTTAYLDPDTVTPYQIDGTWDLDVKGNTRKVFIEWDLPDMDPGEDVSLKFYISTDINTGTGNGKKPGHQEFTSEGTHVLNSGATVKFTDQDGDLLSVYTDVLSVEAYYD